MIPWACIIVVFATLCAPCTTCKNADFRANLEVRVINDLSERYLSVSLDSDIVRKKWNHLDLSSAKLHTLARGLAPAYLRFGGTDANYMCFDDPETAERCTEDDPSKPSTPFIITKHDVQSLYTFCRSVGWHLVFDLNAFVRNGSDWDPSNPLQLLHYMASQGMMDILSLQLGNEPNSYKYSANVSLTATQVAKDFLTLVDILHTDPELHKACNQCLLVGPDVTNPKLKDRPGTGSPAFLKEYLQAVNGPLDAITWHQYYVNGHTANLSEFTSPEVLDYLPQQIKLIQDAVAEAGYHGYPMWLGETSSAYDGGAPGLSDTYAAGFMWLDKLGVASRDGLDVVVRQSLYGGNYALLDKPTLKPRPDYWLSLVYKRLVGQRVLNVTLNPSSHHLRLYAHCTNKMSEYPAGSVVFYGLNLYDHAVNVSVDVKTGAGQHLDKYLLTPVGQLSSRYVQLNGEKLMMPNNQTLPPIHPERLQYGSDLHFPARTFGFYALAGAHFEPCVSSAHTVEPV